VRLCAASTLSDAPTAQSTPLWNFWVGSARLVDSDRRVRSVGRPTAGSKAEERCLNQDGGNCSLPRKGIGDINCVDDKACL